jgi:flagellar hook-length control protein FliK
MPIILVPTHVENPGWTKDFGQHVIRLAVEGQPAAEIHLNPPDLGPIRVSIEMKGQDATLQFVAAHPQTREALEGSMPRLREIFAGSNITLASADVASKSFSDQSFGSNGQRFPQPSAAELTSQNSRTARIDDTAPVSAIASRSPASRSRVDLFA